MVIKFSASLGFSIELPPDVAILGHVGLAIAGLALIEHLLRNTHPQRRWATKFLYLGLGSMFAYDFFLYSDTLLFKQTDLTIWEARGFVNVMVVPLLAVAAARNPEWSVDMFVSRQMARYSATTLGAGLYLLVMAGTGYYIREFGGRWGTTLQVTFLFGAGVLLAVLLSSGQVQARLKVFFGKHFYHSKYDYREEWLRFTRTLSVGEPNESPCTRAIRAIAEIVCGTGGLLWTRYEREFFAFRASWNAGRPSVRREPANGSLISFLEQCQWIIDLDEYARDPASYAGLTLPDWLGELQRAWLVIPLIQGEALNGFLVLTETTVRRELNWEDRDLLKTAGRQVAGYVALLDSSEALSEARQFEAFHRLSAYVVHDLKNIAAQLTLVVGNADRHKSNPAFIEDAFGTVANATRRMNRLLTQLRTERPSGRIRSLALADAARQAIATRTHLPPEPVLRLEPDDDPWVRVDQERLIAVLEHLIQNAQEATGPNGQIEARVRTEGEMAVVAIRDDGCGMNEQFIHERLFRPFTTTKGNAGMGIGVYESREFARGAGGELAVESSPGKGTTFFLKLPLIDHSVMVSSG
ncbi:MAG: PEP-CTERM system histidine kinase PrsK [Candidatus Competibacter sp.]|nr:PEP-CTERM system histidine kinase PrsK [Candidatus Competibacter sp.]